MTVETSISYNIAVDAIVTNQLIVIKNPTPEAIEFLELQLSYQDKSKQFQLHRMSKNSFLRNSKFYDKVKAEVSGSLLYQMADGNLAMSSGFAHLLTIMNIPFEDRRTDTGQTISLPWSNKPFDLRDYQEEAVNLMVTHWRGLINLATALGKTLVAIHAIRLIHKRVLVVVPSESIADQFYKALVKAFGESRVGMFGAGRKKIKDITVGIAASVYKNIDLFKAHELGLVIFDETHHISADTFYKIAHGLGDVGKIFGLTATDYRSDGKDVMIAGGCGETIVRRDIRWGIDKGWLAKPYFIIRQIDTTHKRDIKGDKLRNYKEHVLNCVETKDQIASDIKKFMDAGKYVLCLVDEVAHGQELADQLGIPFATGQDKDSKLYVELFNRKKCMGLIGTDGKISEGTDMPNVDVLVLANFVAAKGSVIQAIGRSLRKTDTKSTCIILDYYLTGSTLMMKHADKRIRYYKEITDKIKVI